MKHFGISKDTKERFAQNDADTLTYYPRLSPFDVEALYKSKKAVLVDTNCSEPNTHSVEKEVC